MNDFINWFDQKILELGINLYECVIESLSLLAKIALIMLKILSAALLSPIWVIPYIYWFFRVKDRDQS